jgi:hypothetical protein
MTELEKQNNTCAICGNINTYKSMNVDHNHTTGEIRGLLCHTCNKALGLFKEDLNILTSACNYLKGNVVCEVKEV